MLRSLSRILGPAPKTKDESPDTTGCYREFKRLRAEMDAWLAQSIRLDPVRPEGGDSDELNYALAWLPHYLITRNPDLMEHFDGLVTDLLAWIAQHGVHGYEPDADVHHGPEPFCLLFPRYLGLRPDHREAVRVLDDAAEHIGNWVDGIPAWYDYERDVFQGYWLGTRTTRNHPDDLGYAPYEVAEHFRFIHMAMAAYRYTGEERYLTWALRYGRARARRIITAPSPMPLLWDLDGNGLGEAEVEARQLRPIASNTHHLPGDPIVGIENLLASGAVYAFGDLYAASPEPIFEEAARRIVEPFVDRLLDPYADPGISALAYYRIAFGSERFDDRLRESIRHFPVESEDELVLYFPQKKKRRGQGVGRRSDMVYWGRLAYDGTVHPVQEPTTAALTLAYHLTGEISYATRAFRTAADRMETARRLLRGGREHADMGCAVCSVAAGHGRNWGQGNVTGCYGPLLLGTVDRWGELVPAIEFRSEDGVTGVPDGVLSLVRRLPNGDREVLLANQTKKAKMIQWRWHGNDDPWSETRLDGLSAQIVRRNRPASETLPGDARLDRGH